MEKRAMNSTKNREEDSAKTKEEMLKLASSTQFGGPGYIIDSTFMTERLLWLFIFLAFSVLTIHDLYNTISGYISGPTSTDTTILFNETMSYNGTTFCVAYSSMQLNWGVDLTKSEQTMKVLDSFSDERDILAMLQNETNARAASIDANLVSLIMLTTTMLGNIVKLENVRFVSMNEVDHYWGIVRQNPTDHVFHVDNKTTESIERVYQFYVKRNISFVDLHPVIAKLVLRQMNATFFCERLGHGKRQHLFTQVCSKAKVTWFGRTPFGLIEERLCFKFPDGTIMFHSNAEACILKISPTAIYGSKPYLGGSVNFDLSGHNIPQGDVTNMWGVSVGQKKQVDIQILGEYTSLYRPDVPCEEDDNAKDFVDCKGTCRASKIYEMCKCWPLSWWHLAARPSDARYCTQPKNTSYIGGFRRRIPDLTSVECNDTHFSYVIDDDCAAKCNPPCRQAIYVYTEQRFNQASDSQFNDDDSWENRTIIYMDTPSFIYPEITQSFTFDLGKCFADLGGNISLWLGGSIIGLVHIIIYSCRVALDVTYGKQVKKKEANFRATVVKRISIIQAPSPERLREQQRAIFRYALQKALRTYNARGGEAVRHGSSNYEHPQIVCATLGHKESLMPASSQIELLERLAELEKVLVETKKQFEKELTESKQQVAEQQTRISALELLVGAKSEALGQTD